MTSCDGMANSIWWIPVDIVVSYGEYLTIRFQCCNTSDDMFSFIQSHRFYEWSLVLYTYTHFGTESAQADGIRLCIWKAYSNISRCMHNRKESLDIWIKKVTFPASLWFPGVSSELGTPPIYVAKPQNLAGIPEPRNHQNMYINLRKMKTYAYTHAHFKDTCNIQYHISICMKTNDWEIVNYHVIVFVKNVDSLFRSFICRDADRCYHYAHQIWVCFLMWPLRSSNALAKGSFDPES